MKIYLNIFSQRLKWAFASVWLASAVSVSAINPPAPDLSFPPPAAPPMPEDKAFSAYRKWDRVTPKPVKMPASLSADCAPANTPGDPHADKFINVFVNKMGRDSMLKEKKPQFAEGTIIVKEKLAVPNSAKPELMTAMVKREEGFNPAAGDWEFFVLKSPEKIVLERGKLSHCQSCHSSAKQTDYVFRRYLSAAAQEKLR